MATPFLQKEWETITSEELATARARFTGFIEAVPDKEKVLREVYTNQNIKHSVGKWKCMTCVCVRYSVKNLTWKLRLRLHVKVTSLTINHSRTDYKLHVISHEQKPER
jgi:hypothetical protein